MKKNLHSLKKKTTNQILMGYPVADHAHPIYHSLAKDWVNTLLVNVGNPFYDKSYATHDSKEIEVKVIQYFMQLYGFQDGWGYIATGSTEGNVQGLLIGRDWLQSLHKHPPIFFFSRASHYSLSKAAHLLQLESQVLAVNEKDEVDLEPFIKTLEHHPTHRPILLNVTMGTTMYGAIDPYVRMVQEIRQRNIPVYVHADMALYGPLYRFCHHDDAYFSNIFNQYVDSFVISGHKMPAMSVPSAVFVVKEHFLSDVFSEEHIPYIATHDWTLAGCRNGLTALLWAKAIEDGDTFLRHQALTSLRVAQTLSHAMHQASLPHILQEKGIIIVFPKPCPSICARYQLAVQGDLAHVVCLPHIQQAHIESFVHDMQTYYQDNLRAALG